MTARSDSSDFCVHLDPTEELGIGAREFDPENPFYTAEYAAARRDLGDELVLLSGLGQGVPPCPGFLRRGAVSCRLDIPSLSASPPAAFVDGLKHFCESAGVYEVTLNTYASPPISIPALPMEIERVIRTEFLFDLRLDHSQWKIGRTHRQRIKQAEKNGLTLRRSAASEALREHVDLISSSMRRRKNRGEDVAVASEQPEAFHLLHAGAAEVFQAVCNGVVLSSALVLKAERGGYDHSSGTRPEGMAIGASHFLVFSVARALQLEKCTTFNLGGARVSEEGLRAFKTAFGTISRGNVMVRASLCTRTRRTVTRAAQAIMRSATRARSLLRTP
jgi:hypothetical protein